MNLTERNYHAVCDLAEQGKGVQILYKHESWLMRLINKVLFWMPKGSFMENFTTTIGSTIYLAGSYSSRAAASDSETATIAHELVHVEQFQRLGLVPMSLAYLFPHWLGIFSLGAFLALTGNLWFLLFLVFLGFLAPIPAPWRMIYEVEAYATGYAVYYWVQDKECPDLSLEQVERSLGGYINQFTGANYYFMWPFKKDVAKRLHRKLIALRLHEWDSLPIVAKEVYEVTKGKK